jgi:NTP pyrophosphatase (non-canonical NTP hydrolase)
MGECNSKSKYGDIANELADFLIFLISIANKYDIDSEKAFRDKEDLNKKRI